ncbi:hypothetical protein [Paludisphaera mucosa]|uniref:Uncharacterized protein n=1 Tax=Paludisphaera mucosa TaxID=3030827 RepID=A0ABT6FL10_9BACT|nr:hypothetical protein [Paludisphaera mucosa]MDG3008237.1 hypothetical protein [Paludisphaera mucosa]
MKNHRRLVGSALALLALGVPALHQARSLNAAPPGDITLLGVLSEWQYPGSRMVDGATMSDGGDPKVQSIKCTTVLVTPDPFDKVAAFYAEKLGTTEPEPGKADAARRDAGAVSRLEDSQGRSVKIRVFVANQVDAATTLVVSRVDGEAETHVAWSHYRRFQVRP